MNIKQAVPFFRVSDMKESIRFYVDGLGCEIRDKWEPEGQLRWCWLTLGEAALMLQQFPTSGARLLDADGESRRGSHDRFHL